LDDRPFPKPALIGAGLLVLTTIVGVGTIQLQKRLSPPAPVDFALGATALETRDLRFIDQGDGVSVYGGHVRVFDVATGQELPQLQDREGFVRAVLNSLTYERTKGDVRAEPVFELVRWSDNRITIADKATGAHINLGDFGPGNKAAFLRFFAGDAS
jgi:putative photosynthetic complex assembly protein